MTGMNRSTVIECVKTLTALKIVSPLWRYKEDGSHASNQYNFPAPEKSGSSKSQGAGTSAPSHQADKPVQPIQGSRPEPPPLVAQDDHPSRPEPPEQSSSNKKIRTITEVDLMATERQKTCPHPSEHIVMLPDNITICNHCYGLLDDNLKLIEENKPAEIVSAA
jgi:hypothetical protein